MAVYGLSSSDAVIAAALHSSPASCASPRGIEDSAMLAGRRWILSPVTPTWLSKTGGLNILSPHGWSLLTPPLCELDSIPARA
jgi:hypothetical protein